MIFSSTFVFMFYIWIFTPYALNFRVRDEDLARLVFQTPHKLFQQQLLNNSAFLRCSDMLLMYAKVQRVLNSVSESWNYIVVVGP